MNLPENNNKNINQKPLLQTDKVLFDSILKYEDEINRHVKNKKKKIRISLESIGAKVNSISPQELFWWYVKSGFFYPKKKRKLTPYLSIVEDNWKRALSLGDEIFWIATVDDKENSSWASICNWRTTLKGWVFQHLVASGNSAYPLLLMLGTTTKVINEVYSKPYMSCQNWYRPTNKYANKVFGIIENYIGATASSKICFNYFTIPQELLRDTNGGEGVHVVRCTNKNPNGISEFIRGCRNEIYLKGEELDVEDIELCELNDIYERAGLQRKRFFWLAFLPGRHDPVGALIVYRAPIGLNFSMLENRSELILSDLREAESKKVCTALMKKAMSNYEDFLPSFIPLVADQKTSRTLSELGLNAIRSYNQFIWEKDGYSKWYEALWGISKHSIQRWKKYHH